MKPFLLTFILACCACNQPGKDTSGVQELYDPSKPPLTEGQCSFVRTVSFSTYKSPTHTVFFHVFDSAGTPLPQFTIKALRKPYSVLSNVTYFSTDQSGRATVFFGGCDSLELANLSVLSGRVCRLPAENLPDTITIRLSLTQEKFIPSTL